jgi:hypothetical protein
MAGVGEAHGSPAPVQALSDDLTTVPRGETALGAADRLRTLLIEPVLVQHRRLWIVRSRHRQTEDKPS